jgi:hypothetical protein
VKRPILVSLAAVILSLGLLGSSSAHAATPHAPTAATMNPASDPPDLVEVVIVLVDRVTDALFHDRDRDHDRDHDGDRDRDHDGDRDGRSRCRGVIAVCLG